MDRSPVPQAIQPKSDSRLGQGIVVRDSTRPTGSIQKSESQ